MSQSLFVTIVILGMDVRISSFVALFFRNVIGRKYLTLLKPEGLGKCHQTLYSCGWGLGMRLRVSPLQFSLNHQASSYFYF